MKKFLTLLALLAVTLGVHAATGYPFEPDSFITSKGDLIIFDGTNYQRIGSISASDGQVLTVSHASALGLVYGAGGGGGSFTGATTNLTNYGTFTLATNWIVLGGANNRLTFSNLNTHAWFTEETNGNFTTSGQYTGNASGLTNVNAANLTGGPSTNAVSTGAAVIAGNASGITNAATPVYPSDFVNKLYVDNSAAALPLDLYFRGASNSPSVTGYQVMLDGSFAFGAQRTNSVSTLTNAVAAISFVSGVTNGTPTLVAGTYRIVFSANVTGAAVSLSTTPNIYTRTPGGTEVLIAAGGTVALNSTMTEYYDAVTITTNVVNQSTNYLVCKFVSSGLVGSATFNLVSDGSSGSSLSVPVPSAAYILHGGVVGDLGYTPATNSNLNAANLTGTVPNSTLSLAIGSLATNLAVTNMTIVASNANSVSIVSGVATIFWNTNSASGGGGAASTNILLMAAQTELSALIVYTNAQQGITNTLDNTVTCTMLSFGSYAEQILWATNDMIIGATNFEQCAGKTIKCSIFSGTTNRNITWISGLHYSGLLTNFVPSNSLFAVELHGIGQATNSATNCAIYGTICN